MRNLSGLLKAIQLDPNNDILRQRYRDFLRGIRDSRASAIDASFRLDRLSEDSAGYESLQARVTYLLAQEHDRWCNRLASTLRIGFRPTMTFQTGLPYCFHVHARDGVTRDLLDEILRVVPFSALDLAHADLDEEKLRALLSAANLDRIWELWLACVDCCSFPMTALAATPLNNIHALLLRNIHSSSPRKQELELTTLYSAGWSNQLERLLLFDFYVTADNPYQSDRNRLSALQVLVLSGCDIAASFAGLLAQCSQSLEELTLSNSSFLPGFWHMLFDVEEAKFPRLIYLNLSRSDLGTLDFEFFPSLEELELEVAPRTLMNCLVNNSDALLRLKRLRIRDHGLSSHDALVGKIEERFEFVEWL